MTVSCSSESPTSITTATDVGNREWKIRVCRASRRRCGGLAQITDNDLGALHKILADDFRTSPIVQSGSHRYGFELAGHIAFNPQNRAL
jgi:hypothetical protein